MSKPFKYNVSVQAYNGKLPMELFNWCDKYLDHSRWVWGENNFSFTDETDAILFSLKWSRGTNG